MNADHRRDRSAPPMRTAAPSLGDVAAGSVGLALLEPSESGHRRPISADDSTTVRRTLNLPGGIYGGRLLQRGRRMTAPTACRSCSCPPSVWRRAAPALRRQAAPPADARRRLEAPPAEVLRSSQRRPATRRRRTQASSSSRSRLPSRRPPDRPRACWSIQARICNCASIRAAKRSRSVLRTVRRRFCASTVARASRFRPSTRRRRRCHPNATPFVDPVTLLAGRRRPRPVADLAQRDLRHAGWRHDHRLGERALPRHARRAGRTMALRDLPTIPSNRAGQAQNTAVSRRRRGKSSRWRSSPTSIPACTFTFAACRRRAGESLALVPAGTQMELRRRRLKRAIGSSCATARRRAPSPAGSAIDFITLQRNSQPVDFDRLQELNELTMILTEDQRGSVVTTGQADAGVARRPAQRRRRDGHRT